MIESYLQDLLSDQPALIEEAIFQLGESGQAKAVAPLVRALLRFHEHPEFKALICDALGELSDLRATQALLSHLRDPDEDVRDSAFTALFNIGQKRAQAMPDAEQWVQGIAEPTEVLTQIAWQTDLEAVQLLLKGLEQDEIQIKVGALYTLGQLGFVGAFSPISQLLLHPHPEVSAASAFALGELARLGHAQTATQVCQSLYQAWQSASLSLEAQIQVLRAAAECHSLTAQAHTLLAELFVLGLQHSDSVIRQLAVIGLGRLADDRAASLLASHLYDSDIGVRRNAAYALGQLKSPELASILVKNSLDQPSEVRVAIQTALSHLPYEQSLLAVQEAANSSNARYRAASTSLLGMLKDQNSLLKTLQDDDSEVRKTSALAVGSAKLTALTPILISMLNDSEWRVRAAAAEGLKRLRNPQAIVALQAVQTKESHPVVISALESALISFS